MILVTCLLVGLAGPAVAVRIVDPELHARLDAFTLLVSSHVARQDTAYPIFRGCVDWHSAVHGHWALLRAARVDPSLSARAAQADSDLTAAGLERERELMRQNPSFEMPYGRAWFLRLAVEHEDWSRENGRPDGQRLRAMADELARSILQFYDQYPATPQSAEYANASWALAQLYAYYNHTGDAQRLGAVARLIREGWLKDPGLSFAADAGSPEFFSLYGNWAYLIVKTQPAETARSSVWARPLPEDALRPVARLLPDPRKPSPTFSVAAHHLGVNWSRAWALKALADHAPGAGEQARLSAAYRAHVAQAMLDHARYAADYARYGHWIPQFAVYALTEGLVSD